MRWPCALDINYKLIMTVVFSHPPYATINNPCFVDPASESLLGSAYYIEEIDGFSPTLIRGLHLIRSVISYSPARVWKLSSHGP